MKTYTELLNDQQIKELKNKYLSDLNPKQLPHVNFQIKKDDCTITVYNSKKVVYQGTHPEKYLQNEIGDEEDSIEYEEEDDLFGE